MTRHFARIAAAGLLATALAAPAAHADHKHRRMVVRDDGRKVVFLDTDRTAVRTYWTDTYHDGCPPGLVRSGNTCYPSGVTTRRYVIGRPLARTIVYDPLPTVLAPRLRPAPAGYRYAVVDGDVVLINTASRVIADAISHIFD